MDCVAECFAALSFALPGLIPRETEKKPKQSNQFNGGGVCPAVPFHLLKKKKNKTMLLFIQKTKSPFHSQYVHNVTKLEIYMPQSRLRPWAQSTDLYIQYHCLTCLCSSVTWHLLHSVNT